MKLFIDTTQNYCNLVIISLANKIVDYSQILTNKNMTDIVVERISNLLTKNKIKKGEIEAIYLLIGPGSFTGCRIGYTIAKTWANLLHKKLFIMNSLLFQLDHGTGISLIDAKSDLCFLAIYDNYKEIVKPSLIKNSSLDKILKKYQKFKIFKNYECVDLKKQIISHLNKFELVKDLDIVKPLYLKHPIVYENCKN